MAVASREYSFQGSEKVPHIISDFSNLLMIDSRVTNSKEMDLMTTKSSAHDMQAHTLSKNFL